jgi:hypothetical protein
MKIDGQEAIESLVKLAKFFDEMWRTFVDGGSVDGFELQSAIERTGLVVWRPATADEAANFAVDIEEGDPALFLTDEGKWVLALAADGST